MGQSSSARSGSIDLGREPKFQIGRLAVDPSAHEAQFAATTERLQPQPLKVLVALARDFGQVVTRDELIDSCWGGRIIGQDVINRAILLLRSLGKRSGAFSIETVRKSGYRLVANGDAERMRRRMWSILTGLALCTIALLAGATLWLRSDQSSKRRAPVIAVLPVTSGDPAFRSLSVAVRNALLHMLSDASLPAQADNGPESARSTADFILVTDLRRDGDEAVGTLQLQDARHGDILFSKVFRSPVSEANRLTDRIGAYAGANLAWAGTLRILDRREQSEPRLTTELLKQLFLTVEGGDLLRAYEISEQIARKAPDSTMAQLSLAHNTGLAFALLALDERPEALARAREAMLRARRLSPDYGDTYTPTCLLYPTGWQAYCEDQLREGLRIDPEAPYVSAYLRRYLSEVGRNQEALRYARMSLANDPYKPGKLAGLVGRLEALDQQSEAAELFDKAIRWWPELNIFYLERVNGMAQRGDLDAVARFAAHSPSALFPADKMRVAALVKAVHARNAGAARSACTVDPRKDVLGTLCLVALNKMGDLDAAFRLANLMYPPRIAASRAEEERIWINDPVRMPTAFLSSPALAPMRGDPRFLPLASSVGLTRYWRSGRPPDFCRAIAEKICAKLLKR